MGRASWAGTPKDAVLPATRCTYELAERLAAYCRQSQVSQALVIRLAVTEYLNRCEDAGANMGNRGATDQSGQGGDGGAGGA